MNASVWEQRFALALAALIETGDGSDADVMLRTLAVATCARLRMPEDVLDVLQDTWDCIIKMARKHITPPEIAKQVRTIARRRALDIMNRRERIRSLERQWADVQPTVAALESDEIDLDAALATLLSWLKNQNEPQYSAVTLALQSSNHEEARRKWESAHNTPITADNFRQLHSRGVRKMRRHWEQSND